LKVFFLIFTGLIEEVGKIDDMLITGSVGQAYRTLALVQRLTQAGSYTINMAKP